MYRTLLVITTCCITSIMYALTANASDVRRYSPPMPSTPQPHYISVSIEEEKLITEVIEKIKEFQKNKNKEHATIETLKEIRGIQEKISSIEEKLLIKKAQIAEEERLITEVIGEINEKQKNDEIQIIKKALLFKKTQTVEKKIKIEKNLARVKYLIGANLGDLTTDTLESLGIYDDDFSLEYNLSKDEESYFGNHYVLFDFSILEVDECSGDKCLSEEVKSEIKKIFKKNAGTVVYPLFDKEIFSIPTEEQSGQLKHALNFDDYISDKEYRFLYKQSCYSNNNKNCFASINDKILLKYTGEKSEKKRTSLSFIIIDSIRNVFIDAINISMTLSIKKDEQGEDELVISDPDYSKYEASITLPKEIEHKHTLVVLKDKENTTFALFSKGDENSLNLSTWSAKSSKVEAIYSNKFDEYFKNKENFIEFSRQIKEIIIDEKYINYDNVIGGDFCEEPLSKTLEIVYPNRENNMIRPLPVEYLMIRKDSDKFIGNCYLVSHKTTIENSSSPGRIDEIRIFMDSKSNEADDDVLSIANKFEEYWESEGHDVKEIWKQHCIVHEDDEGECFSTKKLVIGSQEFDVYWHGKLPDENKYYSDSLLIFNGHYAGKGFKFNKERTIPFLASSLGEMTSPNYLLNVCGDPADYPFDEAIKAEFRNLIYAYKKIYPEEAANSMICAVDSYIKIDPGECKSMSEWMKDVRTCMKDRLNTEQPNDLAFHLIGTMEEQVCRKEN